MPNDNLTSYQKGVYCQGAKCLSTEHKNLKF